MLEQQRRILCGLFSLALAAATTTSCAAAGPKITVGRTVPAAQRISMDQVDHTAWDGLLRKYVNIKGQVNYRGWKSAANDVAALDRYLEQLSRAESKIRSSGTGRVAYWINAYNALTIKGILREYPTTSIRNHTAKLVGYNIWHDLLLIVGDSKVSLNDIEHNILRKVGQPMVHFAIVCASHSCPRLLNRAYTGRAFKTQLVENTKNFFANRENFQYSNGRFYLSSILKWFAEDFGSTSEAQLQRIAPYLPDEASRRAAQQGSGRISYLKYDWDLNEQTPRTAKRR